MLIPEFIGYLVETLYKSFMASDERHNYVIAAGLFATLFLILIGVI